MKTFFCLALFTALALPLHAHPAAGDGKHPCQPLKKSCEAAGFVKGGHKAKKGLYIDCMQLLMDGKSVEGVTAAADEVAACKAKKAEHGKYK